MLPKKPRRMDATSLIWEYLEGEISPSRAEHLSAMLAERASVRDQLVGSAVLHGMLFDHYNHSALENDEQQPAKSKHRRSSAA